MKPLTKTQVAEHIKHGAKLYRVYAVYNHWLLVFPDGSETTNIGKYNLYNLPHKHIR